MNSRRSSREHIYNKYRLTWFQEASFSTQSWSLNTAMEPRTLIPCRRQARKSLVLVVWVLHALRSGALGAGDVPNWRHSYANGSHISPPAMIVFGDSILDTGNNNRQLTYLRCNYPPYGRDFIDKRATGRFSNGRLVVDYVAEKLGLPYTLPYLRDSANSDFEAIDYTKGINFASGGSGWLRSTADLFGAVAISTQIEHFDHYISDLKLELGEDAAKELLAESIYVINMGSNDYFSYINPVTQSIYTPAQYADMLLAVAQDTIQQVHERGGRRIAVVGVAALGCVPVVRQLLGLDSPHCVQSLNDHVTLYNSKLDVLVASLRQTLEDATLVHVGIYPFFLELFQQHQDHGLTQVLEPCCGVSKLTGTELDLWTLQPLLCPPGARVCANASTYLFWDSLHPSDAAYKLIADYVFPAFMPLLVPGYQVAS